MDLAGAQNNENDNVHVLASNVVDVKSADELERKYVHHVYDNIAAHFRSNRRHKAWPKVKQFLNTLPDGSIVADIGCGSGKYFKADGRIVFVGLDVAEELLKIAATKSPHLCFGTNLQIPFRDNLFDAVLSISVIHHFCNEERRLRAISELARILRPGGKVLIYVWALEQPQRQFCAQDVLVPWKRIEDTGSQDSIDSQDGCEQDSNRMVRIPSPLTKVRSKYRPDNGSMKNGDTNCPTASLVAQLDIRHPVRLTSVEAAALARDNTLDEWDQPAPFTTRLGKVLAEIEPDCLNNANRYHLSKADQDGENDKDSSEKSGLSIAAAAGTKILSWISPRFTRKAENKPTNLKVESPTAANVLTNETKASNIASDMSSNISERSAQSGSTESQPKSRTGLFPSKNDLVCTLSRFSPALGRKAKAYFLGDTIGAASPEAEMSFDELLEQLGERLAKDCIARAVSSFYGVSEEEQRKISAVLAGKSESPAAVATTKRNSASNETNHSNNNNELTDNNEAFYRFYHVFQEGELAALVGKLPAKLKIINAYYDHANWCILAEKI